MSIRPGLRWPLFLAAAFLFSLVALLPMRLALDWLGFGERGLSARAATGSLWLGALQEAQVGPVLGPESRLGLFVVEQGHFVPIGKCVHVWPRV